MAFITDRERDAALLDGGYATYRITWERLHDQADREARRLRRILAQRDGLADLRKHSGRAS